MEGKSMCICLGFLVFAAVKTLTHQLGGGAAGHSPVRPQMSTRIKFLSKNQS